MVLGQKHSEDKEHLLVGRGFVVAVAVEDERGARRQLLQAVDDGGGPVAVSSERPLQLAVDVHLDPVAVPAGRRRSVDVEHGGVMGGGEGGRQPSGQAVQSPLGPAARHQDEADGLCGPGSLEMPFQVNSAPLPQFKTLAGELALEVGPLGRKLRKLYFLTQVFPITCEVVGSRGLVRQKNSSTQQQEAHQSC